MKEIQSPQNQYIKTARQLKNKKFRQKRGLFFLEGIRLMEEALNASYPLEYVLVTEDIEQSLVERLSRKCQVFSVSPDILSQVTETENPQGVAAVARQKKFSLCDLAETSNSELLMVVDGVQDPGNLGTIIRTADAAGACGIIMTAATVDLYNSKTVRSSMGSLFRVKTATGLSPSEAVEWLLSNGYKIIVGHVGADRYYHHLDYSGKIAIVVGNENSGPCSHFREAGYSVKIPCRTESLNVSIASAILLYEKVKKGHVLDESELPEQGL